MNLSQFHPYLVHFPIALFTIYFVLELFTLILKKEFLFKSAHLILFLGMLGAVGAVLTGNAAYSSFKDWNAESLKVFNEHQNYANITLWYFAVILIGRTYLVLKKKFNNIFQAVIVILAAAGIYFILSTGYYGGQLVNKFGINKEFRINSEK